MSKMYSLCWWGAFLSIILSKINDKVWRSFMIPSRRLISPNFELKEVQKWSIWLLLSYECEQQLLVISCSQRNDRDVREIIPELIRCSHHLFIVRQTQTNIKKIGPHFQNKLSKIRMEWCSLLYYYLYKSFRFESPNHFQGIAQWIV